MSANKLLQAAAGNAGESIYVEDVFSTYLYEGNQTARSINNGLDLSGEGGLVWLKNREQTQNNYLFDTENGANKFVLSDSTAALQTVSDRGVTAFNSNGFDLGTNTGGNRTGIDYVSWSFRKQAGFFDVVTYTGDGTSAREIAHNLGCKPAIIIVKNLDQSYDWAVWHKSFDVNEYDSAHVHLNTTDASTYTGTPFPSQLNVGSRDPSANFYVHNNSMTNTNGVDYVAYLFADGDDTNAQIFGDNSDEAIIKCGTFNLPSYTDTSVSLGFEPQWVLAKNVTNLDDWRLIDVMRGAPMKGLNSAVLRPNISNAEAADIANQLQPQSDGFIWTGSSGWGYTGDHIYIAIRRPMKTPEAGTEVFSPYAYSDTGLTSGSGTASNRTIINGGSNGGSGFPVDLYIHQWRNKAGTYAARIFNRLSGKGKSLMTNSTAIEGAGDGASNAGFDFQEGVDVEYNGSDYYYTSAAGGRTHITYHLKRATGFMDVVAYTGTGSATTVNHNLGVVPELLIIKNRSGSGDSWVIYDKFADLTTTTPLFSDFSTGGRDYNKLSINSTAPTASVFSIGPAGYSTNTSGVNYIAYMWASVAGVSKIGSYSGTGSNVDVDCGFSAGARFVMITRSDSGGNWYYWDSLRGIVAGNDPYLQFGEQDVEVTNTDYIDPLNAGFTITSSAPAALNASGGTYIFLAIA